MMRHRNFGVVVFGVIVFFALIFFLPFQPEENKGLALLALVAILWLSEAVHVTITALIVPVAGVLLGLEKTKEALDAFSDPTIFLFFGGFALSAALHKQGLDRMIANRMISLSGGKFSLAVILLFLATALLSMGISNTATAAMMLPLAIGLLSNLEVKRHKSTYVFVVLGIAYSANIGGMGTLVGSPPNAIVASNLHLTFSDWLKYGLPVMAILLPLMIGVLYLSLKPELSHEIEIKEERGKLNKKQISTIILFIAMALLWVFSKPMNLFIGGLLGVGKIDKFDSVIAILGVVLMCGTSIVEWRDVQKNTDWGVLLLFGGGLTLSTVLTSSGASKILVDGIVFLIKGNHFFVIGIVVTAFIVFLTEFTSNTASAALLVPILISIAEALNAPPLGLAMIVGIGASCAFMMPVATPPNALAYGTGFVSQREMLRVGFLLNIVSIIVVSVVAYFFWT